MCGNIQEKDYYLPKQKLIRNNATGYKRRRKRKTGYFNTVMLVLMTLFATACIWGYFIKEVDNGISTGSNSSNQLILFGEADPEKANIYQELKELSDNDPEYADIFERRDEYPIDLLNGLIHNSEMLEFVKGYFGSDKNITGLITAEELQKKNPLFIQWDKRWGYADYGDSMMAVAGCGPTSLSMAIVSLTGNEKATPLNVAKYSYENGYYASGRGSLWKLISEGAKHYGLTVKTLPSNKGTLTQALDAGNVLILAMGPGKFTSSGHYIVIYDYDENGFYVNDPNSYSRSEKVWQFSEFGSEIKNIWALCKDNKEIITNIGGIIMNPVIRNKSTFKVAGYGINTNIAESFTKDIAAYWDTYNGENAKCTNN